MRRWNWLAPLVLIGLCVGCDGCDGDSPSQEASENEAQVADPAAVEVTPTPGPIIIVDPSPGSGNRHLRVGGPDCTQYAESASNVNRVTTGTKLKFETMLAGSPEQIERMRATFDFGGTERELIVQKIGNDISWSLGGTSLSPVARATDQHLREDICGGTLVGDILVVEEGKTAEVVATDVVEIQVEYRGGP